MTFIGKKGVGKRTLLKKLSAHKSMARYKSQSKKHKMENIDASRLSFIDYSYFQIEDDDDNTDSVKVNIWMLEHPEMK